VILIDDAHTVFPAQEIGDTSDGNAAAHRFVKRLWAAGGGGAAAAGTAAAPSIAVVVIAPEDPTAIHEAVAASLLDHVTVGLPDTTEARAVLDGVFRGTAVWGPDVDLAALAERCRGRSVSDLMAIASLALRFAAQVATEEDVDSIRTVGLGAVDAALGCLSAKSGSGACVRNPPSAGRGRGWALVTGMDGLKHELDRVLLRPLRSAPSTLRSLGLSLPRGVLLYGAPGVGKTLVASAVAEEAGLALVEVTLGQVAQGEVGASERAIAAAFKEADRFRPCAVLLDDVDVVFGGRGGAGDRGGIGSGVVSQVCFFSPTKS
jgi:SpoVK/Ycf46/Vps4 family AAA+-type ATPase